MALRGVFAVGSRRWRWAVLLMLPFAVAASGASTARAASIVYIADSGSGTVAQFTIAAGGGLSPLAPARVASGAAPQAVVVSPDGTSVYVADYGTGRVSQFDAGAAGGLAPKAPATVAAGSNPAAIAMSRDGKSVYVANYGAGSVSQFDVGAGGRLSPKTPATVGGIATPAGIAVSPDGRNVYVTNFGAGDNRVSQFDVGAGGRLSPKTPATVATGLSPVAVAVSPDGRSAYVTNSGDNNVSQFTIGAGGGLKAKAPARVAAGKYPYGVAGSPDGKHLFVTNADGDSVSQFDVVAGGVLKAKAPATVATGTAPFGIAVSIDRPVPPPPPPPPPPPAPRNLTLPSIVDVTGSPHTYRCSPGTWDGAVGSFDPSRGVVRFTFTWQQLTPDASYLGGYRVETVASGDTYRPTAGTPGELTRRSWLTRCVVQTSNAGGSATALSPPRTLIPALDQKPVTPPFGNLRIRGIDLFQTVQPNSGAGMFTFAPGLASGPFRDYPGGGTPTSYVKNGTGVMLPEGANAQVTGYDGVTLDARKPTVAVVYTDVRDRASVMDPTQPLEVTLAPLIDGRPMTYPDGNRIPPARITTRNPRHGGTRFVTEIERRYANLFGVEFAVEPYWLQRARELGSRLDLEAHVSLVKDLSLSVFKVSECGATDCSSDNTFRLVGVPLEAPQSLTVQPVYLFGDARELNGADEVLARAQQLYPGGDELAIRGPNSPRLEIGWASHLEADSAFCGNFAGSLDPTRACRMFFVGGQLTTWALSHRDAGVDFVVGIHRYPSGSDPSPGGLEPGWTSGSLLDAQEAGGLAQASGYRPIIAINDGSRKRPLTAAAHEFGHVLGLPHADSQCAGNAGDQISESWLPDQRGRLQGTAFDTHAKLPAEPKGFDDPNLGGPLYDLMSYCAGEGNAWLSPRNWNHTMDTLRRYRPLRAATPAARAAAAPRAFAWGVVGPNGGRVVRVAARRPGADIPASVPDSPIRLRSLDRAGNVLEDVGVAVDPLTAHVDGAHGGTFVAAASPAARTVELVRGGTVLDRLDRSRPPHVRLLAPRRGARVRTHGTLVVRWRTRDPDGDPRHAIPVEASVDYSSDAGRTWSSVYQGPDRGRAAIAGSTLQHSRRARVRVTINDGFNETHRRSRAFRADGAAPKVRIIVPVTNGQLRPGARSLLVGSAFDDHSHRLRGRALSWYAGRKRLGTGEKLVVRLPAGRYPLRLRARDRSGRTGTARLRVRVQAEPLRIVKISYPTRIARRTRKLTVTIRTSAPATLRVHGHRFRTGTHARLVLPLPRRPAAGVLRIPVKLAASGGRRLTGTIQLRRG
jgi:YVTN family beta-propeller protein